MSTTTTHEIWNVPNVLTLSRLPLSALLFVCISYEQWLAALIVFAIASVTDALDGWWARRFNQFTSFGRTFDPLIDKVLVGGAFIYLMQVPAAGLSAWMVTVIISRELLITGIRGYIESLGIKFGADWFGKIKMILQCVVLLVILTALWLREKEAVQNYVEWINWGQFLLIYVMILATIGSGLQYVWRASQLLTRSTENKG